MFDHLLSDPELLPDVPLAEALRYTLTTAAWIEYMEPIRADFERRHGCAMPGHFRIRILMRDGGREIVDGTWGEAIALVRSGVAVITIDNGDGGTPVTAPRPRVLA